jgi:hypothetical protein
MEFPTLPAEIKKINRQLIANFGINTDDMQPMWRVSWSNDQYEKRLTDRTDSGIILLTPEVRELPKYQWVRDRWMLERLIAVPEVSRQELADAKTTYECMWAFSDRHGNPLKPSFEACKFVVDLIYAAMGQGGMKKYIDPDLAPDAQERRIKELELALFGDESGLEGKTFKGEGIVVPQSYDPQKEQ